MSDFCQNCDAPVAASDVYCSRCGAALKLDGEEENANPFATSVETSDADAPPEDDANPNAPEIPTRPLRAAAICLRKFLNWRDRANRAEFWLGVGTIWGASFVARRRSER